MSQTEMVMEYMEKNGSIDPMRALEAFGCMRLGARIFELRAAGVSIQREIKTNPITGKRWAEYRLA